jgi:hypothetical protein
MRNLAAFIGLASGGYIGWLSGIFAEGVFTSVTQTRPGHKYAYVTTFVMASLFAFTLRRVVGDLSARGAVADAKVEHAAAKAERTVRSGRTPPAPSPAF